MGAKLEPSDVYMGVYIRRDFGHSGRRWGQVRPGGNESAHTPGGRGCDGWFQAPHARASSDMSD